MKYNILIILFLILFFSSVFSSPFDFAVKYSNIDVIEDELFDLIITDNGKRPEYDNSEYLGYVSLGEIEASEDKALFKIVKKNDNWDSFIVDYSDKSSLLKKKDQIKDVMQRFDGVFIDNIDSYYHFDRPPFKKSSDVLSGLFSSIKKTYPEKKIIINRGFEILDEIARNIDGILFENFRYIYNIEDNSLKVNPEFEKMKEILKGIKRKHPKLDIYVIEYVYDTEGNKLASTNRDIYERLGLKVFFSDINLNHIRKYYQPDSETYMTFYPTGEFFESPVHCFLQTIFEYYGKRIRYFRKPSQVISPELYSGLIMYDDGSAGIYDQEIIDFINRYSYKKLILCGYYDEQLEIFKQFNISKNGQIGRFVNISFKGYEISPALVNTFFSFKKDTDEALYYGKTAEDEALVRSSEDSLLIGCLPVVDTGLGRSAWLFDPFRLFSKILKQDLPIPSLVVNSGNRIAYTHVDADGMDSTTDNRLNIEIFSEKVSQRFKELPFSLSFITSIIDESINPYAEKIIDSIRKYLYFDNIEFASHSFSHPFIMNTSSVNDEYGHNLKIPDYKMDFYKEIKGSLEMLKNLFPEKTVNDYYWTGDCRPPEKVIEIADENNIRCINGGDPEYSGKYNSLTFLSPFTCQVGDRIQYYANSRNEFIDTSGWKQDYHNISGRIDYFKNTAAERLLKPIDVYYHFYIVENKAALNSLIKIYEYLSRTPHCNMFTSDYLKAAYSYTKVKMFRDGDSIRIYNDDVRAFRLPENISIDLVSSENIIGMRDMIDGRYVFLGKDDQSILKMSDLDIFDISLISSNIPVDDLKRIKDEIFIEISEKYRFIHPEILLKLGVGQEYIRNIFINGKKSSFIYREDYIEIQ